LASTSFWQAGLREISGGRDIETAGPLEGNVETEVVVVGAGITGTATALWLARAGVPVRVLEARQIAAGASGRNGGFLATGTVEPYASIIERFGREQARRLWAASVRNAELAEGLIEELREQGWLCGYRRNGSLKLAGDEAELAGVRESVRLLQEDGWNATMVERAELPVRLHTAYIGGSFNPDNAEIQPAKFVLGLARLARQAGAVFHEESPVSRIVLDNDGVTLRTERGSMRARNVVLAINAWLPGLSALSEQLDAQWLAQCITPTRGQMIATEPVGERLFPCPCSGDHGYQYWRQLEDGRLVVGGWRNYSFETEYSSDETPNVAVQRHLDAFVHETLGLPQVRIDYRWAGIMAFSKDSLPLVGCLPGAPHCYISGGYTGHGNAYALQCAHVVSELVQGRSQANDVMLGEAKLFDPARFKSGV
jgi:gamma-glutamylputrescine oxidase